MYRTEYHTSVNDFTVAKCKELAIHDSLLREYKGITNCYWVNSTKVFTFTTYNHSYNSLDSKNVVHVNKHLLVCHALYSTFCQLPGFICLQGV